ncbi:MAG: hypothetical protein HN576_15655 [Bacteriovoracaceae bacterium]|nr:hypothetical protein [Bacteriovoracaceae bacterium]
MKDSFLDQYSQREGLEVKYHFGKVQRHFYKWYRYRFLSKLLKSEKVIFIHCYDLNLIWPICFFLRNSPMIPLFLTIDRAPRRSYLEIWHKALLTRVDQVFVSSESMIDEAKLRLGLLPRKITVLGYGVSIGEIQKSDLNKIKSELAINTESHTIGSLISPHHKNMDFILPLIYAVNGYNQKHHGDKDLRLILISEKKWNQNQIYKELIRFIKDAGSEEDILFYSGCSIEMFQRAVDLWISSAEGNNLSDYAVKSLLLGVPILVPRNAEVMELFNSFPGTGEAYRKNDSLGVREKLEKVLAKKKTYLKQVAKGSKKIKIMHSVEAYSETLISRYKKTISARKRAATKTRNILSRD